MNKANVLSQTVNCKVIAMRHNPFDMLKGDLKFPLCTDNKKASMDSRLARFSSIKCHCPHFLTMILLFSVPTFVYAADGNNTADDKCSPDAWLKLDTKYMEALRASDMGRLQGLRSEKEALLQECNRSGFPGKGPTGPGGATSGPGSAPTTVTGPGSQPGTGPGSAPPIATGPGIPPGTGPGSSGGLPPSVTGPASPENEPPAVTGPGTPPTAQVGGDSEGSGGAAPDEKNSGDTLTAEEEKRKEEWNKRQEFTERMVREQAALTEANSGPVVTVWNDFWGSVFNGGKPTPVEPLRVPSFAELLSDGDPLATRLQQIRDQVGNGVPTQQQLDEIRGLSRDAQQGQAESAVAIVKSNASAADLAQAGEIASQIGASAGQAAAEYVLVNSGVPRPIANAATTAIYDGLQHYDKGVTAVIVHGTVSAATGALGNAAGNKVGSLLGEAAETVGGRVLQGAAGGAVSAGTGKIGHTTADGKEIKVGEVIQEVVVGGVVGGVIKPVAGAINDIDAPTSSSQSGGSIVGTVDDVKTPPVKLHWPGGNPRLDDNDIGNIIGAGVKPVVGYATSSPETDTEKVKPEPTNSPNIKLPDVLPAE